MINWIKKYYNKKELSVEMYMFNIIHTICVIGVLLVFFLSKLFFDDIRAAHLCFGVCVLFMLTMFEANRTGKAKLSVAFMSIVFNIIFMPAMMYMFGKYICVMPVYFLFGILYTILLLDVKTGLILCSIEIIVYAVVLSILSKVMPLGIDPSNPMDIHKAYGGAFVAMVFVGTCCGAAIRFRFLVFENVNEQAQQIKAEATAAYVAKDMFLINMSHEIRTPMNAIVGTVDLLLDKDVPEQVSDSVYNILNSCNALLSITDELMDLSKSESGDVSLYTSTYDLNDLLFEVINMMTIRLTESNLDFLVDINKNIPRYLYGDLSKVRQVLVNVLNNAVKYTTAGKIVFRVDYKLISNDKIELIIDVEDTGCGIRREDIPGLFERKNEPMEVNRDSENVEGTGIGLVLCSEILKEMKGEISVQSEFNKGSVFTIKIPQKFTSMDTVAYIQDPFKYKALVFEKNQENYEHVKKILDDFSIESDSARNRQDMERLMNVNKYSHVFIANEKYEECEQFLNDRLISEKIIAFLDIDDNIQIKKAQTILTRPIHTLNVAALIKNETNSYVREVMRKGGFTCPKARILVVDDNYTNLNVASAILSKYGAQVVTAPSGRECIRIVSSQDIDMVFLDYMMPEMNGIDTLEALRKLPGSRYAAMPVVALTANVISGAREMFLEAGFDDFMAKPISVDKMERTLKKYLARELIEYTQGD